jgi:hypothetical protein
MATEVCLDARCCHTACFCCRPIEDRQVRERVTSVCGVEAEVLENLQQLLFPLGKLHAFGAGVDGQRVHPAEQLSLASRWHRQVSR